MCGKSFVMKSSLECHMATHVPKNGATTGPAGNHPSHLTLGPSHLALGNAAQQQQQQQGSPGSPPPTMVPPRSLTNIQASIQSMGGLKGMMQQQPGAGGGGGAAGAGGPPQPQQQGAPAAGPGNGAGASAMCAMGSAPSACDKPTVVVPGGAVLSSL
ncbi:hypothetical protein HPB47_005057 [Ixodes persulcatus]|uniref:Uncharacterized protein n=1 Tax=Ixodes persulcatus TaxID=34615 RepID=A0AC60PE52_IXOPE|nr:hypothetical protein HPB47_005057 [Ixodes persulcatus]